MKKLDIMDACKASAKDFCETLLFCLEDDGIFTKEDGSLDGDFKKEYKDYLDSVLEYHYNTDFGEQGENITKYLDECFEDELTLLLNEGRKIENWLKENSYSDECISTCFGPIGGRQCRAMDFEYNGNINDLDIDKLAFSISKNVIDEGFSVRVSTYDEEDGEEYENLFCVEVLLND